MRTLLIYIVEVVICSGVLTALYSLLLERKVSYLFARVFLLLSVVAAAAIPTLNIPVYSAEFGAVMGGISVGEITATDYEVAEGSRAFDFLAVVWGVYGIGVALSIMSLLLQFYNIARIRYRGEVSVIDGVTVVRSSERIASFSFFNTIFISSDTQQDDLATIISHERSHIAHRHSVERLAMELLKALLWWNPFVWITSRRLTEVEEFEADHDVIESGCDAEIYVTTLLKHLFGYSPEIANGLHNSLTKKRLKMILKNNSGRYALLRKLAVIPVLGILLSLFSFTTKEAVAKDVQLNKVDVETTEIKDYQDFYRWVVMNVQYPAEAREQKLTGSVIASFTIDTDGNVKDVNIVKSNNELFTNEVRRVLAKAPAWRPLVKDGKRVEVKYMLPVNFILDDAESKDVGGVVVMGYSL